MQKETHLDPSMTTRSEFFLKSSVMRKTAGLLVALIVLSATMPIMALAGVWFKNVTLQNGVVTGDVYVLNTVYGDVYEDSFYVDVINSDGTTSVTKATYTVSDATYAYYRFTATVTGATYVDLNAYQHSNTIGTVTDGVYEYQTVTERVYDSTTPGGGTVFIPPAPTGTTTISAGQISSAFAGGNKVATIEITSESAQLPASALKDAPAGAVVKVENTTGSYSLPTDALDYDGLAEQLGVSTANLNVTVTIAEVTGETAEKLTDTAEDAGGTQVGKAVDFEVKAEANGKSVAITDFGSTYVERSIKNVNADSNATGVLYDPATGEFSFIPATFANGVATLKSTTNSIYAVVEFDKSFADVKGHWAKSYVESMANKLIAQGYEDGSFGPDRSITRAEFATLVVRALGLSSKSATASFKDVKASDWYANAVAVAAQAGIVKGYEDGTFQANKVITREELAAMVVRASAFAGTDLSISASEVASALAAFSDADGIVWANAEIASAAKAGIVNGFEDGTFGATKTATRAEASTMLQRFLTNANLISE